MHLGFVFYCFIHFSFIKSGIDVVYWLVLATDLWHAFLAGIMHACGAL